MSDEQPPTEGSADYEDVTEWWLDVEAEEAMLAAQTECAFIWANKEGWPVGVIMSFIWRRGRFGSRPSASGPASPRCAATPEYA